MITRRRVILALGAGAFAPLPSIAQPRKLRRIGVLWEELSTYATRSGAFKVSADPIVV